MIAAIIVIVSFYFAIRVAMVELLQNLQGIYHKWEEKSKNKITMLASATPLPPQTRRVSFPSDLGKEWQQKRRNGQVVHTNSRNRSRFSLPSFSLSQWNGAQFKVAPTVLTDTGSLRPLMGACCTHCVPASRMSLTDNVSRMLGMTNILKVPTQNRENRMIVRTFHDLSFVIQRGCSYLYPDVSNKVLQAERVQRAIDKAITDELEEVDCNEELLQSLRHKNRRRAVESLRRLRSCISSLLLRLAGWVLYKLLGRILSSIQVHKGQIETLKKASRKKLPIVYLPLHRSHLDYILVTFILYMNDLRAPLIAAGDNLLIPFFGTLMRGLGAFFIKRKLDLQSGKKDHVYRSVLHTYMAESLRAGHSLEFFIEGGRSRSGKACLPKAGLLSVVVDSVCDGLVEDAYIVPVAISYEKIMDGNFVTEQLGKPKVMENFPAAVRAIWRTLHSSFGSVRVDFCQPFSLKEFIHSANRYNSSSVVPRTPNGFSRPQLRSCPSTTSLYGTDIVMEDQRSLIKDLAEHIVYDGFNATALMSTNLLAFLLLTKHRKGATLQQLSQSLTWLREELGLRKRDVGFSGEVADVVKHASSLLGRELITSETIQMEWSSSATENSNMKIIFYRPVVRLPHVLELQYYANSVLSAFLMESVVVNALFTTVDDKFDTLRGCESKLTVSRNLLVKNTLDLCDILQYEFIFAPPCTEIGSVILETINQLITSDLLSVVKEETEERAWANRLAVSLECTENMEEEEDGLIPEDQNLKVNLSEEAVSRLEFLRCILSPYIEAYWLVACSLLKLVHTEKEESLFFRDIQKTAEDRLHKGLLSYEESFAAEPLKNALKLYEHWNVVEKHYQDSVRLFYLQDPYNCPEMLEEVIAKVEAYKK